MKVIGITGGVGSGKTEVANYIGKNYYAFLIFSDLIGASLMKKGNANYNAIVQTFGTGILNQISEIDKEKLRQITFNDNEKLKLLSSITWPNIVSEIEAITQEMKEFDIYDYIIIESAILFESGLSKLCDETWYVHVNKRERIRRLQKSRNYSLETCNKLMNFQMNELEYSEKVTFRINNSLEFDKTKKEIDFFLTKTPII